MNNKQKFKILLNISLCGCILFFAFSALGMYFYPGGTMWHNDLNPDATIINYYSHTLNFFSDLGLEKSWSGLDNSLASSLFLCSLFSVAIGIISFYTAFHYIFKKDKKLILLSKIGVLISSVSAIGFICVGFTPADTMHTSHMSSVNLAFRSFLIVMLIYSYLIFRSHYIKNYLSFIYFILFFLVGYYVYIIVASPWTLPPVPYGHEGFYIPEQAHLWNHVVSQKFVVYGLSFSILWQLFELKKQKYIHLVD